VLIRLDYTAVGRAIKPTSEIDPVASEKLQLQARGGEVILRVKVTPGSSRNRIVGLHAGALKLAVSAPAEHGKANQAVIKLLAQTLGVRDNQLRLTTGQRSPHKTIAIRQLTVEQALARLKPFCQPRA
jgi:uncharacterized protein (TIGR00251 family)